MSLIVRLGGSNGLVFNGDRGDALGFYINEDGFKGWNDGLPAQTDETPFTNGPGSFDVPPVLGSRVVTLEGYVTAKDEDELGLVQERLIGLLSIGKFNIQAEEFGRHRWAPRAYVRDTPRFQPWGGQNFADYQLQVWVPKGLKFGEVHGFHPGTKLLFNYGNWPAAPVYTITGSAPGGYTLYGPAGRIYTVTRALNPGEVHTVDMRDGYLRVNGVIADEAFGAKSDTWAVPGGGSAPIAGSAGIFVDGQLADTYS